MAEALFRSHIKHGVGKIGEFVIFDRPLDKVPPDVSLYFFISVQPFVHSEFCYTTVPNVKLSKTDIVSIEMIDGVQVKKKKEAELKLPIFGAAKEKQRQYVSYGFADFWGPNLAFNMRSILFRGLLDSFWIENVVVYAGLSEAVAALEKFRELGFPVDGP